MNRIPIERRTLIAHCIVEGNSIRATARIARTDPYTVLAFLRDLGDACEDYSGKVMRELKLERLELDEIWSYVFAKDDKLPPHLKGVTGFGDVYTWTAIDPVTKLVPAFHAGKRTATDANLFMHDLASRIDGRIQLTSDGFKAYEPAIQDAFGTEADYGQLHKIMHDSLGKMTAADWLNKRRYSQPELNATKRLKILGNPDESKISTSIVERHNLTIRMSLRRLARATNAYSKTMEGFQAALSVFHFYYNFCRLHSTIRCTPAMEAKLCPHVWSLEEFVSLVPAPVANRPKTYRKQPKAA